MINILLKYLIIVLVISQNSFSKYLINLCVQKGWKEKIIISCGYNKFINDKNYMEFGINVLPARTDEVLDITDFKYEKKELHSLYGLYTGYHLSLLPLFRPGVILGTNFKRNVIYKGNAPGQLVKCAYSKYQLTPYFGMSVQLGILSFVISNVGIGGGVNLNF